MKLIKKIFGYCGCCRKYFKYPKRYRMNTNYGEDEDNITIICKACEPECDAYWDEQWKDLYW